MKSVNLLRTGLFVFGLAVLTIGCKEKPADVVEEVVEEVTQDAPAINDAMIASIAVTANQNDIDYAKIAMEKGSTEAIRNFAQTMIQDHQGVIDQALALAEKLGVTPEDNNPTTQTLLGMSNDTKTALNGLEGADFDKAYINNEVEYHKFAIDAVENTLIPNASNDELKGLLQAVLPSFKMHLEHAMKVQEEMNK